jgi:hypothetical protein
MSDLLGELLFGSKKRVFRLETRPEYDIPEERDVLRQFAGTGRIRRPEEFTDFVDAVRRDVSRGVEHIRVRVDGGLYTGPGGGLYTGPGNPGYRNNWPPREVFAQELEKRGLDNIADVLRKAWGSGPRPRR